MKVLHLIDSGGLYGAEKMLLALMDEQRKNGVESELLSCGEPNQPTKAIEHEAKKLGFQCKEWRMQPGFNSLGMLEILEWAKSNKITHLHSHGFKFNVLIGLASHSLRQRFKWTVTVHGYVPAPFFTKQFLYNFVDKRLSRRADRLCLVSPAMLEMPEFKKHKKSSVVLNGISSGVLGSICSPNIKKNEEVQLLLIGRLSPEKGIDILLQSVAQLVSQNYKVRLTIMGEGDLKDELSRLTTNLKIQNVVDFRGFVDNPAQYLSEFDALVMPSLTEGIPITILEAMREKLPIVASLVGGIPFVLGEQYKYLVTPNDVDDLTANLVEFIDNSESNSELVNKNYQRFINDFTAEKMHQQYLEIYQSI